MSFVLLLSTLWAQSPPGALVRSTHTESASTLALTLTSTALRTVRNKSIFFTQLLCYSNIKHTKYCSCLGDEYHFRRFFDKVRTIYTRLCRLDFTPGSDKYGASPHPSLAPEKLRDSGKRSDAVPKFTCMVLGLEKEVLTEVLHSVSQWPPPPTRGQWTGGLHAEQVQLPPL